jgi:hypothetical protein
MNYTAFNGDTRWADINGLNVPTFTRDMFQWRDERPDLLRQWYEQQRAAGNDHWAFSQPWESADKETLANLYTTTSGGGSDYAAAVSPLDRGLAAGWEFTPEARGMLSQGGWDLNNSNNIALNVPMSGGAFDPNKQTDPFAGLGKDADPLSAIRDIAYKNSASTGLRFQYVQGPDGRMVPVPVDGTNWDSNNSETFRTWLAATGMMAGGAAAAAYAAPAAAGTAAGETAATAAGVTEAGLTASSPEVLAGIYGGAGEPLVGGLTLGELASTGAIGAGVAGPAASGAGSAAGGSGSIFEGIAEVLGGSSGGSSMIGDLVKQFGPEIIKSFLPGAAGAISGSIGEKTIDKLLAEQTKMFGDYKDAGMNYASGIRDLTGQYAHLYAPRTGTAQTGFGTGTFDPTTGMVTSTLSPVYQAQRDAYNKQFGDVTAQIGSMDPQAFAKNRYDANLALMAEGDAQAQSGLMQDLMNKGGFGLTLNQQAAATPGAPGSAVAGQGSVGVNPYVDTFLNAQNRRNANLSVASLDQGQAYLDKLLGRQAGFTNAMSGIDARGDTLINQATGAARDATAANTAYGNFMVGGQRDALAAERDAIQKYIQSVLGARSNAITADGAAQQGMVTNAGSSLANQDWGKIIQGISSLFGSWGEKP